MKFGIKKFSLKKEKPSDLILEKVLLKEETLVISDDVKQNKLLEYDELQRQYVDNPTVELGQAIAKLFNEIYNPRPESNHESSSQGLVEETDEVKEMIDVSGNKGSHVMNVKQDQDNTIIQDTVRAGFVEEPDDGTYIDPNVEDVPAKVEPTPETQEAEASVELDNDSNIGTVSPPEPTPVILDGKPIITDSPTKIEIETEPLDPNIEDMIPAKVPEQTTPKFNVKVEGDRIIEKLEPKVEPPADVPAEPEMAEDKEVESSTTDLTEPVKIPEVDLSEPIKIPDEIPANADLTPDELEKLAQVKNDAIKKEQEVLNEIGAERRRKEQEAELVRQEADKEKQYVDYLWKLVDDDLKEQKQKIIDEQLAKQPEKKLERKSWSEKTKEAEELVLSIAGNWLSDEEYSQSHIENTLDEFDKENKEIDESIAKLEAEKVENNNAKQLADDTANRLLSEEIEYPSISKYTIDELQNIAKEKENKEKAKQLADETIIDIKKKRSFWKREKKPEVVIPEIETPIVPTNDLTMPADLSPELKKVWEFLPNDNKLEIIQKHKDENVEIIQEKKKKLFGNKINFSLKRQQMKQPELVDKPKLFAKIKSKIIKVKANDLHGIEAYCNICKHEIKAHQLKGKSSGCSECGCLTSVQSILDVNHIKLKLDYSEIDHRDSGKTCNCGHREIVHKDKGFCEEQDCYCIGFKDQPES